MDKLIVNFTPTGMLMKKADTPYIPINPNEIIQDVKTAYDIGISSVHLHARNSFNEDPSYEKGIFEEIILGIREFAPDLIIAVTTSGRIYNEFEKRTDVLDLEGMAKPDMGSLTLSSLNFNKTASLNDPEMIQRICSKMNEKGIKPELEVFDSGMINYAKYLIKKNLLKPPYFFSLILGNIACAQPNLLHAGVMLNDLPENSVVVMGGIGNAQLKINALAISMGYGIRIGLEDNIWFDTKRTKLATNDAYLLRAKGIARALDREICTPAELRKILKLDKGYGNYGVLN